MTYLEKYELWLNQKDLDPELKQELEKMDDKAKKEAFEDELSFGTGGLRGIMGAGTNRLNLYTLARVARGYGNYLLKHDKLAKERGVVICYDNRKNSARFARYAAGILAHLKIKVFLFKELRPTPYISFAIRHLKTSGGLMITASHNPKEYNGVKAYNDLGTQLNLAQSDLAIKEMEQVADIFNVPRDEKSQLIEPILEEIDAAYLEKLKTVSLRTTSQKAKILYSPLHGAGLSVVPKFMKELGYNLEVYKPHGEYSETFVNAPCTNPELEMAWEGVAAYASKKKPFAIVLTDPDCDRAGIAFLDRTGNYTLLNGNQQAGLVLDYILRAKEENKTLVENNNVISTVVTSDLVKDIATYYRQNYILTLTGFKFIAEAIDLNGGSDKFSFACEESIGAIIAPYVRDKDGIQLTLMFCEIANYINDKKLYFPEYFESRISKKYGYYLEHTQNVVRTGKEGQKIIQNVMDFIREKKLDFKNYKLLQYADFKTGEIRSDKGKLIEKLDFPKSNVLKFFFDFGWVVFRPSGTEPKLKIYFSVREDTEEKATVLINEIVSEVYLKIKDIIK